MKGPEGMFADILCFINCRECPGSEYRNLIGRGTQVLWCKEKDKEIPNWEINFEKTRKGSLCAAVWTINQSRNKKKNGEN